MGVEEHYINREKQKAVEKRKLTSMIGNKTTQHVRMGTLLHVGMVSSYPMEREKKEYIGAHAK